MAMLHACRSNDSNGVARQLESSEIDPGSVLLTATGAGATAVVHVLLSYGADVHTYSDDAHQHTALHLAAMHNYTDIAKLLLQHRANPNIYSYNQKVNMVAYVPAPEAKGAKTFKTKKEIALEAMVAAAAPKEEMRLKSNA
jgi:ankyrin repeat protein